MLSPGASRSTILDMLENEDSVSCLVVEPTVTALDMHPGALTESVWLSLPAAITVAMPADFRLSIIGLRESESQ